MTSRKQTTKGCHQCDIIREQLNELHDTFSLTWRNIANIDQYKGIPAGTLCAIAKGKKDIPNKYKPRFGILVEVSVDPCPIHGKPHLFDCQTQNITVKQHSKPRIYKSLYDWPISLLRAALENREVVVRE